VRPRSILINNAEVAQIGNQEEPKKVLMKNFKLSTADFLPIPAPCPN